MSSRYLYLFRQDVTTHRLFSKVVHISLPNRDRATIPEFSRSFVTKSPKWSPSLTPRLGFLGLASSKTTPQLSFLPYDYRVRETTLQLLRV
ncbi:hypothetical protein AVEN_253616-1 [Araneus ventricosus]|uniref:Uncharacterized protein n=1 Tax=Araneus ventricosus TaxID=182803 RepID=A0A4Y2CBH2_ARAVE|nr:hypothetical protein AVEN_253616-1 [Araneus ventricosus]